MFLFVQLVTFSCIWGLLVTSCCFLLLGVVLEEFVGRVFCVSFFVVESHVLSCYVSGYVGVVSCAVD